MAKYTERDITAVLDAANLWKQNCLIGERSIISDGRLWSRANFDLLNDFFNGRLDEGEGNFYEKLARQMEGAPPDACKLMGELLWILLLFPSNIGPNSKRDGIVKAWNQSGDELRLDQPMLSDDVLLGIGSGGTAYNNFRWREVSFAIRLFSKLLQIGVDERTRIVDNYEILTDWLMSNSAGDNRQFRHMLRYVLHPEKVERMSSTNERAAVLDGFKIGSKRDILQWTDKEVDRQLLMLRERLADEYGKSDIDFYLPPLRDRWKPEVEGGVSVTPKPDVQPPVVPPSPSGATTASPASANRIYYGPPGTGKTYQLQQLLREQYTDEASSVDVAVWRAELCAQTIEDRTWWEVVAAALYDLGRPATVPELVQHPFIEGQAKAKRRKGKVNATIWSTLQGHAAEESKTVSTTNRLEPLIFDKGSDSKWFLVGEWRQHLAELMPLVDRMKKGPEMSEEAIHRYSFVTFHQSISYEEFVEGLAPVIESESDGIQYAIKRGIFLQLCDRARNDPQHPYALIIDEINRANVSRVFGELITLIESDKREGAPNEVAIMLPYSREQFSVPANVHIIGTMNTADRSLASLDIALRRRFEFVEMPPEPSLLRNRFVEGVDLERLLDTMNQRIEVLLDRDHRLGHAYFMSVRDGDPLAKLATVFRKQIIPLLQEYFFEDWQRIMWVLNDHRKELPHRFLQKPSANVVELFGTEGGVPTEAKRWHINDAAFQNPLSYTGIVKVESVTA